MSAAAVIRLADIFDTLDSVRKPAIQRAFLLTAPEFGVRGSGNQSKIPAMDDTVFLDVTLRPNPPMSTFALRLIVAAVATLNLGFGLLFVLRGAWPVTPFMGADVLFLAWALNATRIAANAFERVRLTAIVLSIQKHPVHGTNGEVTLNPYWVRVDMDDPPTSTSRLLLWSHGRALQIGRFLPPTERLHVARALRQALTRARAARPA